MLNARIVLLVTPFLLASGIPVSAIGDFGSETCDEGYVWREACGASDKICVKAEVRDQARRDNAAAQSRVSPTDKTYGPDTCKPPFVWREACGRNDHVCVPLQTRGGAQQDNRAHKDHRKYATCDSYAKDALNAVQLGERYRCFFGGPRWTGDYNAHFGFCINAANKDINGQREARYRILGSCNSLAGKTARAGKSSPDAPGQSSGQKCCYAPGGLGPDGRPLPSGYTCGPQCP